jgi:hypothetical protein
MIHGQVKYHGEGLDREPRGFISFVVQAIGSISDFMVIGTSKCDPIRKSTSEKVDYESFYVICDLARSPYNLV